MSEMNDGGPAFPLPITAIDGHVNSAMPSRPEGELHGMSLRDYLATHAPPCPEWFVVGIPAKVGTDPPEEEMKLVVQAKWRWAYADTMLAERVKDSQECDHPRHRNPGLTIPCPECNAGSH